MLQEDEVLSRDVPGIKPTYVNPNEYRIKGLARKPPLGSTCGVSTGLQYPGDRLPKAGMMPQAGHTSDPDAQGQSRPWALMLLNGLSWGPQCPPTGRITHGPNAKDGSASPRSRCYWRDRPPWYSGHGGSGPRGPRPGRGDRPPRSPCPQRDRPPRSPGLRRGQAFLLPVPAEGHLEGPGPADPQASRGHRPPADGQVTPPPAGPRMRAVPPPPPPRPRPTPPPRPAGHGTRRGRRGASAAARASGRRRPVSPAGRSGPAAAPPVPRVRAAAERDAREGWPPRRCRGAAPRSPGTARRAATPMGFYH